MKAWAARSARDSHEQDMCDEMNHMSLQKPKKPTIVRKTNGRGKRKMKQRHNLPKAAQVTTSDQSDSEVWSEEEYEKYNLIYQKVWQAFKEAPSRTICNTCGEGDIHLAARKTEVLP